MACHQCDLSDKLIKCSCLLCLCIQWLEPSRFVPDRERDRPTKSILVVTNYLKAVSRQVLNQVVYDRYPADIVQLEVVVI